MAFVNIIEGGSSTEITSINEEVENVQAVELNFDVGLFHIILKMLFWIYYFILSLWLQLFWKSSALEIYYPRFSVSYIIDLWGKDYLDLGINLL